MKTTLEFSDFSIWKKWKDRDSLPNIEYPGVYAIAISKGISGHPFAWRDDIICFGESCNAEKGIQSRLYQFDRTIFGKRGHSVAKAVHKKYPDYEKLVQCLFVSIASCERKLCWYSSEDLRMRGEVVKFECFCFAEYYENFKKLPDFNDPKAPKCECAGGMSIPAPSSSLG